MNADSFNLTRRRCTARLLVTGVCVLATGSVATAQNKSGVSPTTISRPSGPGSLEGLGDAFQPALNTGSARYGYTLKLPPGIAGTTPEFRLQYDSGLGFGPAGIGWTFDPGSIRRQVDKGVPRYLEEATPDQLPDRFLGIDGEELVPLQNGYYLAKNESTFVRYYRVGDAWEAHAKDGTKLDFGLTDLGRVSDPTGAHVYRWCLERSTDTNGNEVRYSYVRPSASDRQLYLSEIRYGPGAAPWMHSYSVHLFYEDRPDPRVDYRSGFMVRTAKRLYRVDVMYDDALIRRYELGYGAHPHWSLLTTITPIGRDGVSELPTTTFGYAVFDPGDPSVPVSAPGSIIGSANEPGAVFDNPKVDLIDLNADGLPDLLSTDLGHAVYRNTGVHEVQPGVRQVVWEGPLPVDAVEPAALDEDLAASNVHLADMNGDGLADLVSTEPQLVEFFENRGTDGWGAAQLMAVEQTPPPAPFGVDADRVRTIDLDFDKRIDIIRSDFGVYTAWFNLGDGHYSDAKVLDGAYDGGQFVDFADPGVELADMNGDRLTDIVKITPISVVWFPSEGLGRFDSGIEMFLPDRALDDSPGGNLSRAKVIDINGDGLADLVVERADNNDLWFWLNMGDNTFAESRVITDMPAVTSAAAVRWADINGNGTTDLIYGDSTVFDGKLQAVDLTVLIAGSAHLNALTSIDNGLGRHTTIDYRSTTDYMLDAGAAGNPWSTTVPFPVQVVSGIRTSIGLDLDGYPDEGPDGDVYQTDFVYRDGYYDPLERQFRGFAFVKKIERGDERFGGTLAPTLVTRTAFHTGAPDGVDNDGDGAIDESDRWGGREEEPLKGVELWHERTALPDDPLRDGDFAEDAQTFDRIVTMWVVRDLADASGGPLVDAFDAGYSTQDDYDRAVRQRVETQVDTAVIERQTDPAQHKHLQRRMDLDAVGNVSFEWELGDVDNPDDDLYTGYDYARNEAAWIVDRISRISEKADGPSGAFVSEKRNYYDGDAFVGLPLGQVGARGNLHRREAVISAGPVPAITERSYLRGDPRDPTGAVDELRQQFDEYGNVVVTLDADAALDKNGQPDGSGHERRIEYDDELHAFATAETIVIGGGGPDLVTRAIHDYGFATTTSITDFNGQVTEYRFDTFGRLEREIMPGDDPDTPTKRYVYDWTAPVSSLTTITHTNQGDSPDVVTVRFMDGLGRPLASHEVGGPVMKGVTLYNQRRKAWRVAQPFFGSPPDSAADWPNVPDDTPATDTTYDALGRSVEVLLPPDDHGVRAASTTQYQPLTVVQSDGEDNRAGGPHEDTPKTLVYDGLDRLIEVREVENLSSTDSGTFVTRYRYALPDLPAEIEDALGNVKYMRYDGLGRRIFMNDCDHGHLTYTYDAHGNLVRTVDAKSQQIDYTYDGANRMLTEDYLDDGSPLGAGRSPDVRFHYDLPGDDYPWLTNTHGKLSWVTDLTGATFRGYDARGKVETVVKRIDQLDGSSRDYTTVTLSDSLGREYQTTYPDGSVVGRRYDARGLLSSIPGFVNEMTYRASGQRDRCELANGVTTARDYDPRLRLTSLHSATTATILQDLSYDYDQTDNIVAIHDTRALPPDDPRNQTAMFMVDDSYRLQQAIGGGYGTIDYDYDRLGNMVSKTSPDIADPEVNVGTMTSGGTMGTSSRIGRASTDDPGPHAVTTFDQGGNVAAMQYDANGNLTARGNDTLVFDFKDRLGEASVDGVEARYLYDFADRRTIKRVAGNQTTYISRLSEIRDGELVQYVFAGSARIARFTGTLDATQPIAQRIHLRAGWNLFSFQIDPGTTDPAVLLARIADRVDVAYGYDGQAFTEWRPPGDGATLDAMRPNAGYWIHLIAPAELVLEGTLVAESEAVTTGQSLRGFAGLAPRDAASVSSTLPTATAVWAYAGDDVGWRVMRLGGPAFLSNLGSTASGLGYWVEAAGLSSGEAPPPLPPVDTRYYHPDHLGSTNVTTNDQGELISETVYYPFGSSRYVHVPDAQNGGEPIYRFTDKERDAETGLHYFEARYCDTGAARFIAVDESICDDPARSFESPQVLNLYAYAASNPLRYTDPTGNDPKDAAKTSGTVTDILGAALEFAEAAVKQATPAAHPLLVAVKPAGALGTVAKVAETAGPALKFVGNVTGLIGAGMATAEATEGFMEGEADKAVGGLADLAASAYGLLGGTFGASFGGGYAVGGIAAEQIDKHTSHYDNSTRAAIVAEKEATKATGNETVGKVVGASSAAMESLLPGSTAATTAILHLWNEDD